MLQLADRHRCEWHQHSACTAGEPPRKQSAHHHREVCAVSQANRLKNANLRNLDGPKVYITDRAGAQDVYSCEKGQKVWPRGLIWVAVSIPKMFCWQAWGGAFTPKSPFEVPQKLHLFMLKGPRKKTSPSCSLGFHEYEMDNASNFTRGFTPASNPKRGNEMGLYLC